MQGLVYRKSCTIAIVVLFIGIGIVPSISGNGENLNNIPSEKNLDGPDPALFDIYGYIRAYPHEFYGVYFGCKMKNIGDENYTGSIKIHSNITSLFFPRLVLSRHSSSIGGLFKINTVRGGSCGDSKLWFPLGIYRVDVLIEPKEYDANLSNNRYSEYFIIWSKFIVIPKDINPNPNQSTNGLNCSLKTIHVCSRY